ncbi:MAG: hypothetical protein IJI47_02505 [Eubacterium sp.]|nr:hypothetical protein [Eubacterium sp.]MBR0412424.1 hypothetical protein [Eubacterium sp.]
MNILYNPELDAYQDILNEIQIIAMMHPRLAKRAKAIEKQTTTELLTGELCISFSEMWKDYIKVRLNPNLKSNASDNLRFFEECFNN